MIDERFDRAIQKRSWRDFLLRSTTEEAKFRRFTVYERQGPRGPWGRSRFQVTYPLLITIRRLELSRTFISRTLSPCRPFRNEIFVYPRVFVKRNIVAIIHDARAIFNALCFGTTTLLSLLATSTRVNFFRNCHFHLNWQRRESLLNVSQPCDPN